ncbi:MASE1 domain-containing protein, partial [Legionella norrlandica]|uniref:MASE1 domain-containing protein n=1 Tax=Legionella norrlandica TaxID=1498499 RepID=UPI0005667CA6
MSFEAIKTRRFWYQNVLTAFLYAIGGLASNIWTISNTMVTPLWLPSGIALAMVLRYGNHVFPGIVVSEIIVTAVLGNIMSWQNWGA